MTQNGIINWDRGGVFIGNVLNGPHNFRIGVMTFFKSGTLYKLLSASIGFCFENNQKMPIHEFNKNKHVQLKINN